MEMIWGEMKAAEMSVSTKMFNLKFAVDYKMQVFHLKTHMAVTWRVIVSFDLFTSMTTPTPLCKHVHKHRTMSSFQKTGEVRFFKKIRH